MRGGLGHAPCLPNTNRVCEDVNALDVCGGGGEREWNLNLLFSEKMVNTRGRAGQC